MFRIFIRHFSLSQELHKSIKTPIPMFGIEGRYVSALYSAASQMKQLEEVEKSLKAFSKELVKPTVKDFIETSMVSRSAKSKLLKDVAKSSGMPEAASNFLALVAENGRLKSLRKIINMFITVMVAHRKEALCEVITAAHLESDEKTALMTALQKFVKEGKKIQLTETVDPSIIGGLVVIIEDKHIDLSIARKIVLYSEVISRGII